MSLAERPDTSMPQDSPEEASLYANPMQDPDFLNIDDDEKVEALLFRRWSVQRIARATGFRVDHVQQYVDELDADMIEQLQESPVKVKERQIRMLRGIVSNVMTCDQVRENPKLYLIAMKAMSDERKIKGYDAPVKTANLEITAHTLVQPFDMKQVLGNERLRQALLVIEQETAQLALASGDHPGEVRGDRVAGDVEEGETP